MISAVGFYKLNVMLRREKGETILKRQRECFASLASLVKGLLYMALLR